MNTYQSMKQTKLLDKTDKEIIRMINNNCEQGPTRIGRELNLSHTAIRSRLKRLKRDLIKIRCNVNAEKLILKIFIIFLEARFRNKVINHVKNCPKIINYFSTYGEYNLVLFAVAENIDTMESMIEQCFSFNFTDITKYNVLPVVDSASPYHPITFYSDDEKSRMKCDFKIDCPDCESFKKNRCVGCPTYEGYKGVL